MEAWIELDELCERVEQEIDAFVAGESADEEQTMRVEVGSWEVEEVGEIDAVGDAECVLG